MIGLFGGKWERDNGEIGGAMFDEWANIIEPMDKKCIRAKFNELEKRFKKDVSEGKDIWPPTIALFQALNSHSRVNEEMYQSFTYELPKHTKAEYQEKAKIGMDKIRKELF